MVEAKNFVEKTLGKNMEQEQTAAIPEGKKESIPTYTPPPPPQFPEFTPSQLQINQPPTIQVVEKIVYKRQRIHGFFRTLTIIALLAIGFLMLGESTGIIQLSVNSFKLHQIFPIFIIFSTIIIRSYRGIFGKIFGLILFLIVFGGIFTIGVYTGLNPSSKPIIEENLKYTMATGDKIETFLYLDTLIGDSNITGNTKNNSIEGIRKSDRNLLVDSGSNQSGYYIKLNEDNNRNILQSHISNIELKLPKDSTFDLMYVKNLFGTNIIDLTNYQRKNFKFHAGLANITVEVGNVLSGNQIEIQGTAATVTLNIPKNIGVMMYYKHLAGMLQTPEFDALSGHYFQSKNIAKSKAILNIYVNLGLGMTQLNRVNSK